LTFHSAGLLLHVSARAASKNKETEQSKHFYNFTPNRVQADCGGQSGRGLAQKMQLRVKKNASPKPKKFIWPNSHTDFFRLFLCAHLTQYLPPPPPPPPPRGGGVGGVPRSGKFRVRVRVRVRVSALIRQCSTHESMLALGPGGAILLFPNTCFALFGSFLLFVLQ